MRYLHITAWNFRVPTVFPTDALNHVYILIAAVHCVKSCLIQVVCYRHRMKIIFCRYKQRIQQIICKTKLTNQTHCLWVQSLRLVIYFLIKPALFVMRCIFSSWQAQNISSFSPYSNKARISSFSAFKRSIKVFSKVFFEFGSCFCYKQTQSHMLDCYKYAIQIKQIVTVHAHYTDTSSEIPDDIINRYQSGIQRFQMFIIRESQQPAKINQSISKIT
ncbi:Hypothetical_protein [Hexamita inflata]|uniref:Hypothetical_protein n=1 Tax=Hexamita inflata TaxID=28002 RepID=A0AA86QVF6_9EUKA|nr:Hypothetical protein HINF_LOCUS49177 [Hexamita inflata]